MFTTNFQNSTLGVNRNPQAYNSSKANYQNSSYQNLIKQIKQERKVYYNELSCENRYTVRVDTINQDILPYINLTLLQDKGINFWIQQDKHACSLASLCNLFQFSNLSQLVELLTQLKLGELDDIAINFKNASPISIDNKKFSTVQLQSFDITFNNKKIHFNNNIDYLYNQINTEKLINFLENDKTPAADYILKIIVQGDLKGEENLTSTIIRNIFSLLNANQANILYQYLNSLHDSKIDKVKQSIQDIGAIVGIVNLSNNKGHYTAIKSIDNNFYILNSGKKSIVQYKSVECCLEDILLSYKINNLKMKLLVIQ